MGKTIINQPFGNGLYRLFMVIGGRFIIVLPTLAMLFHNVSHVHHRCRFRSRREARPGAGPAWERSESTK